MTKLAEIRAALVAVVQGVDGVGKVHAFERYATAKKAFLDHYADDAGQVRGWYVRRVGGRKVSVAVGSIDRIDSFDLVGLQGLEDAAASELAFDDLVEAVRDAFDADATLGGVVGSITDPDSGETGAAVIESGPVLFQGVFCHRVRLRLTTHCYG
jgi:hypothetical protein